MLLEGSERRYGTVFVGFTINHRRKTGIGCLLIRAASAMAVCDNVLFNLRISLNEFPRVVCMGHSACGMKADV